MLQTLKLLLPALIPSWRFFDEIAPSPRIEFTLLSSKEEVPQTWQEFRPRPARLSLPNMLARMFWNPSWNESLFLVSCAERLMENPTEHSQKEIVNRIGQEVKRQDKAAPYMQFRVLCVTRHGAQLQKEVTYISPVHLKGEGANP